LIAISQLRALEARQDQLRIGHATAMCDLKLVEADQKTTKLRIAMLEKEVAKSRSLADSFKEKWENSQEKIQNL
jgi:hypothetical protein